MSECQNCGEPQPGDATLCADCLTGDVQTLVNHGHEYTNPLD